MKKENVQKIWMISLLWILDAYSFSLPKYSKSYKMQEKTFVTKQEREFAVKEFVLSCCKLSLLLEKNLCSPIEDENPSL